jgi:hypothetical protein
MYNSETLRFVARYILSFMLVVVTIILIIILVFPAFSLTFKDFTLIYWGFSIASFLLNYQVKIWTKSVVKQYGPQKEKNPVMRKMYVKGDLKGYWIGWLIMYFSLFFVYIIGINVQVYLAFLIFPSWVLAFVLYDFLNDFLELRKIRNKPKNSDYEPRKSF